VPRLLFYCVAHVVQLWLTVGRREPEPACCAAARDQLLA
jgi:hypothetical protein